MARPKNPKAGRGPCPHCSTATVLFRLSPATQRLAYSCDECDSAGYADEGGAMHRKRSATFAESGNPPTSSSAPAISPTPPATPTPRAAAARGAAFGLDRL